jgi:hypothetical protein
MPRLQYRVGDTVRLVNLYLRGQAAFISLSYFVAVFAPWSDATFRL